VLWRSKFFAATIPPSITPAFAHPSLICSQQNLLLRDSVPKDSNLVEDAADAAMTPANRPIEAASNQRDGKLTNVTELSMQVLRS
jgi:hypothetical protein